MAGVGAPGGDTFTSSTLVPGHVTTTVGEEALHEKEPRECHTIDGSDPNHAVCGFDFRNWGTGTEPGETNHDDAHSRASCIAAGHRHCQSCLAMEDLGLTGGAALMSDAIPKSVGMTRQERDVLWHLAAFYLTRDVERVAGQFSGMYPSPMNDHRSTAPDVKKLDKNLRRTNEGTAFFTWIGWMPYGQEHQYGLGRELIPYLRYVMKECINEMQDHDVQKIPRMKSGEITEGDYVPDGHRRRDTEDELVEVAVVAWRVLRRFGITGPLKAVPKRVDEGEVMG